MVDGINDLTSISLTQLFDFMIGSPLKMGPTSHLHLSRPWEARRRVAAGADAMFLKA